jgi:predicted DCC family thiol-disulfide oxidoreductase YuxK
MEKLEREIVVFDGVCVFCSRSVKFILDRDPGQRYQFAPMQSASGRALLERHGLDPEDPISMLLVDGRRAWKDSDAVLRIATRLGGAWRLAAVLRLVPRFLRDRLYRYFARNRYRWFGRRETCIAPTAATRERFLS